MYCIQVAFSHYKLGNSGGHLLDGVECMMGCSSVCSWSGNTSGGLWEIC